MKVKQVYIKNRGDQKIAVTYSHPEEIRGVAFIAHGLGANKNQPVIKKTGDALTRAGYVSISWDMRNTVGESEGTVSKASAKSYLEDLEDVIMWSCSQTWYKEPFVVAGHSLGGMVATLYAEKNPSLVKALIAISPAVSGKLVIINAFRPKVFKKWRRSNRDLKRIEPANRIKFRFVTELLKYDTRTLSSNLTMPVLIVVGENDKSTPLKHQQDLFKLLPTTQKTLMTLPGSGHRFKEPGKADELSVLIYKWINKLPTKN